MAGAPPSYAAASRSSHSRSSRDKSSVTFGSVAPTSRQNVDVNKAWKNGKMPLSPNDPNADPFPSKKKVSQINGTSQRHSIGDPPTEISTLSTGQSQLTPSTPTGKSPSRISTKRSAGNNDQVVTMPPNTNNSPSPLSPYPTTNTSSVTSPNGVPGKKRLKFGAMETDKENTSSTNDSSQRGRRDQPNQSNLNGISRKSNNPTASSSQSQNSPRGISPSTIKPENPSKPMRPGPEVGPTGNLASPIPKRFATDDKFSNIARTRSAPIAEGGPTPTPSQKVVNRLAPQVSQTSSSSPLASSAQPPTSPHHGATNHPSRNHPAQPHTGPPAPRANPVPHPQPAVPGQTHQMGPGMPQVSGAQAPPSAAMMGFTQATAAVQGMDPSQRVQQQHVAHQSHHQPAGRGYGHHAVPQYGSPFHNHFAHVHVGDQNMMMASNQMAMSGAGTPQVMPQVQGSDQGHHQRQSMSGMPYGKGSSSMQSAAAPTPASGENLHYPYYMPPRGGIMPPGAPPQSGAQQQHPNAPAQMHGMTPGLMPGQQHMKGGKSRGGNLMNGSPTSTATSTITPNVPQHGHATPGMGYQQYAQKHNPQAQPGQGPGPNGVPYGETPQFPVQMQQYSYMQQNYYRWQMPQYSNMYPPNGMYSQMQQQQVSQPQAPPYQTAQTATGTPRAPTEAQTPTRPITTTTPASAPRSRPTVKITDPNTGQEVVLQRHSTNSPSRSSIPSFGTSPTVSASKVMAAPEGRRSSAVDIKQPPSIAEPEKAEPKSKPAKEENAVSEKPANIDIANKEVAAPNNGTQLGDPSAGEEHEVAKPTLESSTPADSSAMTSQEARPSTPKSPEISGKVTISDGAKPTSVSKPDSAKLPASAPVSKVSSTENTSVEAPAVNSAGTIDNTSKTSKLNSPTPAATETSTPAIVDEADVDQSKNSTVEPVEIQDTDIAKNSAANVEPDTVAVNTAATKSEISADRIKEKTATTKEMAPSAEPVTTEAKSVIPPSKPLDRSLPTIGSTPILPLHRTEGVVGLSRASSSSFKLEGLIRGTRGPSRSQSNVSSSEIMAKAGVNGFYPGVTKAIPEAAVNLIKGILNGAVPDFVRFKHDKGTVLVYPVDFLLQFESHITQKVWASNAIKTGYGGKGTRDIPKDLTPEEHKPQYDPGREGSCLPPWRSASTSRLSGPSKSRPPKSRPNKSGDSIDFIVGQFDQLESRRPNRTPSSSQSYRDKPGMGMRMGSGYGSQKRSDHREGSSKGRQRDPKNRHPNFSNQPIINVSAEEAARITPKLPDDKKWMPHSLRKNAPVGSDEDPDVLEVVRKGKALLNKLTLEKFEKVSDQLFEIGITTPILLQAVIQIIFDKACGEPKFSEMYARLCHKMMNSLHYLNIDDASPEPLDKKRVRLFRQILLDKCKREFESIPRWTEEDPSRKDMKKDAQDLTEEDYKMIKQKERALGNVRFIGEVYKWGILSVKVIKKCMDMMISVENPPDTGYPREEDVEVIAKLVMTVGSRMEHDAKEEKAKSREPKVFLDMAMDRLKQLSQVTDYSSRIRFMLMDIMDMRKRGWELRIAESGPKTISEIRTEALEKQKKDTRSGSLHHGSRVYSDNRNMPSMNQQYGGRGGGWGGHDNRHGSSANQGPSKRFQPRQGLTGRSDSSSGLGDSSALRPKTSLRPGNARSTNSLNMSGPRTTSSPGGKRDEVSPSRGGSKRLDSRKGTEGRSLNTFELLSEEHDGHGGRSASPTVKKTSSGSSSIKDESEAEKIVEGVLQATEPADMDESLEKLIHSEFKAHASTKFVDKILNCRGSERRRYIHNLGYILEKSSFTGKDIIGGVKVIMDPEILSDIKMDLPNVNIFCGHVLGVLFASGGESMEALKTVCVDGFSTPREKSGLLVELVTVAMTLGDEEVESRLESEWEVVSGLLIKGGDWRPESPVHPKDMASLRSLLDKLAKI